MTKKYFTVKEANALLPILTKEIIEIQSLNKDYQAKYIQLKRVKEEHNQQLKTETESIFTIESKLEFLEMQAQLHLHNIQSSGALLKDIDLGLIDFPAVINNEEVLLCWKLGEEGITHYHGGHEGFLGRKSLRT